MPLSHAFKDFFRDQDVLVTGASGFIGWHVAKTLADAEAHVRVLVRPETAKKSPDLEAFQTFEGDLMRPESLDEPMRGCRYLFHVAGDYRFWARDPREIFRNNIEGSRNILDAAHRRGVERIVSTSTCGILARAADESPVDESRLAPPEDLPGAYKRSKFDAYVETQKRAEAGEPIISVLPTAPIGHRDFKPTPTGMVIIKFLNGGMPFLARTGLNFGPVGNCAAGHLQAMMDGRIGERYLLGGTNLWLHEFLKLLEPYGRHRVPKHYCPEWISYAAACVSEASAHLTGAAPFVTRESVRMSRHPYFFSSAKAEREFGYDPAGLENAIRDAVKYFSGRGLIPPVKIEEPVPAGAPVP